MSTVPDHWGVKSEDMPKYNSNPDQPVVGMLDKGEEAILAQAFNILSRRAHQLGNRPFVCTPEDMVNLIRLRIEAQQREFFVALFLDTRLRLIGNIEVMFVGSTSGCPIYIRGIIEKALELNAVGLIVAHNHPSGVATPSIDDKVITSRIKEACEIMGLQFYDHVVIGANDHFSFKQNGLLSYPDKFSGLT